MTISEAFGGSGFRARRLSAFRVGNRLFLRTKRAEQQCSEASHVAGSRVARATVAADLRPGLVALQVTAVGTAEPNLATLGDLDPLQQAFVRLALWHYSTDWIKGGGATKTDRIGKGSKSRAFPPPRPGASDKRRPVGRLSVPARCRDDRRGSSWRWLGPHRNRGRPRGCRTSRIHLETARGSRESRSPAGN